MLFCVTTLVLFSLTEEQKEIAYRKRRETDRNMENSADIYCRDWRWPYGDTVKQAERRASFVVAEVTLSPSNTMVSIRNDNSNLQEMLVWTNPAHFVTGPSPTSSHVASTE